MDMRTIVLLVRTLMLVGIISPLVIGGVILAIREKRHSSNLDNAALPNRRQWPVVIRAAVAIRRLERRGERMFRRLLKDTPTGARVDAIRAQPWT
jgi:hypothetical protein